MKKKFEISKDITIEDMLYQHSNLSFPSPFDKHYGEWPPQRMPCAAPKSTVRNTAFLTDEQIAKLMNNGDTLQLRISEEDLLKPICNHKNKDGTSAIEKIKYIKDGNETDLIHCKICGKCSFNNSRDHIDLLTTEEIQEVIDKLLNISDTIKTLYEMADMFRPYYPTPDFGDNLEEDDE